MIHHMKILNPVWHDLMASCIINTTHDFGSLADACSQIVNASIIAAEINNLDQDCKDMKSNWWDNLMQLVIIDVDINLA